jgi:hypothetical protein
VKGEARLESGGSPLVVDGLEGNAALISRGGDVKVRGVIQTAPALAWLISIWLVACALRQHRLTSL